MEILARGVGKLRQAGAVVVPSSIVSSCSSGRGSRRVVVV